MRRLEIDWTELIDSFESDYENERAYLDLETGKVVSVSSDVVEHIEELSGAGDSLTDETREAIHAAIQVEEGYGTRFITIPTSNTANSYGDLENFIGIVGDQPLQKELQKAIRGPGAFHRFKEILENAPAERERWFAYRENCEHQRLLGWLKQQEIEPINPAPKPTPLISIGDGHESPAAVKQEFIEELSLLLLYLCSWEEKMSPALFVRRAWKGFPFDVLNVLEDRGLIHQSRKAKSVSLTEEGIELARELEKRYKP